MFSSILLRYSPGSAKTIIYRQTYSERLLRASKIVAKGKCKISSKVYKIQRRVKYITIGEEKRRPSLAYAQHLLFEYFSKARLSGHSKLPMPPGTNHLHPRPSVNTASPCTLSSRENSRHFSRGTRQPLTPLLLTLATSVTPAHIVNSIHRDGCKCCPDDGSVHRFKRLAYHGATRLQAPGFYSDSNSARQEYQHRQQYVPVFQVYSSSR